jgi:hypothetical protein
MSARRINCKVRRWFKKKKCGVKSRYGFVDKSNYGPSIYNADSATVAEVSNPN